MVAVAISGLLSVLDVLAQTNPAKIVQSENQSTSAGQTGSPCPVCQGNPNLSDNCPYCGGLGKITSGVNLSQLISPQGREMTRIPLFNVSGAANTSLLRSTATSTYDGTNWKLDESTSPSAYKGEPLLPPGKITGRQLIDNIQVDPIEKFSSGTLPVPTSLYLKSISSPNSLSYLPDEQLFFSKQGLSQPYSFQAINYQYNKNTLNNAEVDPDPEYLQLPPSITKRTKYLAKDITKNDSSPYQEAADIENYLESHYTYDPDYKAAPRGREPNDWFLFDEKEGVCSNFNSAFVVLARSAGIPSRLVGGYKITPTAKQQTVYSDQAHAWSEVKFKDLGWVTFDATGSEAGPLPTKTEITAANPTVQQSSPKTSSQAITPTPNPKKSSQALTSVPSPQTPKPSPEINNQALTPTPTPQTPEPSTEPASETPPPSGNFPWIYLIIGVCLIAAGVGGFFLYRWRKRRLPALIAPSLPVLAEEPVPGGMEKPRGGITLSLELPQIEPPFPDVWGAGDELHIVCRLCGADGAAMAGKTLEILIDKKMLRVTTDESGQAFLKCNFTQKGKFKLAARFKSESGSKIVKAERNIRIVDYREEIVDHFKLLVAWFRNLGINSEAKATPREIERVVKLVGRAIPETALDEAISCFEETDYSLHSIKRENYKTMYLAQLEMREHESKSKATP